MVDADLQVHHESRESSTGASEEEVLKALEEEILEAKEARPDVVAAGIGIPCTIDRERGVAINAVNLEITDVPIRDLCASGPAWTSTSTTTPTSPPWPSTASAPPRAPTNAVMLTIGTGIGGGVIIDGELYRGSIGAASEPGHMVIDLNGPPCQGTCPNHGCIESLASGTALAREGTAAAGPTRTRRSACALAREGSVTGKTVTEAAIAGDEAAVEVMTLVGTRLASASRASPTSSTPT